LPGEDLVESNLLLFPSHAGLMKRMPHVHRAQAAAFTVRDSLID